MTSYNTNLVLTYNLINVDKDDDELIDDLYRSQFLQTFNLEIWDDTIINTVTESIYTKYSIDIKFREIFKLIRNEKTMFSQIIMFYGDNCENIDLFKMLYNYETFYLLHKYICDLENIKIENKEFIREIIKKIKE
jgi:hypothetical protein